MKASAFLLASTVAFALQQSACGQYSCLGQPSPSGQCGFQAFSGGCMRAGDYCSQVGWCGTTSEHKSSAQCGGGPSPGFYTCKGLARPDFRCGKDFGGAGCIRPFDYCDKDGWCGNSPMYKWSDQCGGPSPGGVLPFTAYSCVGTATTTGQCGTSFNNARCMRLGDFCSSSGWCGSTDAHRKNAQCNGMASPGFYTCKVAPRADNRCGKDFGGAGCSKPFDFCSLTGFCGNTASHKDTDQCGGPSPGGLFPAGLLYTCAGEASSIGRCGRDYNNARCMRLGDYCSAQGWCGTSNEHKLSDQCGSPSPGFYTCKAAPRADNRCGKDFGLAGCAIPFDYCNAAGFCGNTASHKATDQCGGPSPLYKCFGPPTSNGQCGRDFGSARCMRAGDSCSAFGECGSTLLHKSSDQCGIPSPGFYTCHAPLRSDNRCGKDFGGAGCQRGDFCDVSGRCGNSPMYKASDQCGGPSPGGNGYSCFGNATTTGRCGPSFGNARCMRAGDYCGWLGTCGATGSHISSDQCGGPSPGFYTCKAQARADGRCGRSFGGAGCSRAFDFCSSAGLCGNTASHQATDQCGGPSPGGQFPGA